MTAAVNSIWKEFHEELKAFIRKKIGNADDADDVLQEVFVKIMRNIDKVREARDLRMRRAVGAVVPILCKYQSVSRLPHVVEQPQKKVRFAVNELVKLLLRKSGRQ